MNPRHFLEQHGFENYWAWSWSDPWPRMWYPSQIPFQIFPKCGDQQSPSKTHQLKRPWPRGASLRKRSAAKAGGPIWSQIIEPPRSKSKHSKLVFFWPLGFLSCIRTPRFSAERNILVMSYCFKSRTLQRISVMSSGTLQPATRTKTGNGQQNMKRSWGFDHPCFSRTLKAAISQMRGQTHQPLALEVI